MQTMLECLKRKKTFIQKIIVWVLLTVALTFSFSEDLFGSGDVDIPYVDVLGVGTILFEGPHLYSNRLVFCKALADSLDIDTYGWNMGFLNGPEGEYGVDTPFLPVGSSLPSSDGWTEGIMDGTSIFAFYNNEVNTETYQEGYTVVLLTGEEREIVEVREGVPYSHVVLEGDALDPAVDGNPTEYQLFDEDGEEVAIFTFTAYTSQWGLEGLVVSFLYNNVTTTAENIEVILSIMTAIVLMAIAPLLDKKWGHLVAFSYLLTCFASPWIVSFARQYGLIVLTCALPVLGALIYNLYPKKNLTLLVVFACVVLKALCGYEYLSTLLIAMEAFFVLDFFAAKGKEAKMKIFWQMVWLGLVAILAFVVVLLMHATQRGGGDLMAGLTQIYDNEFSRRVLSDTTSYGTLGKLIWSYHNTFWYTPVLAVVENVAFMTFALMPLLNAAFEYVFVKKINYSILIYAALSWTATVSWFALAQNYSYIHTHFAFLLWYFGFVQVCVLAALVLGIRLIRLCADKTSFHAFSLDKLG